MEVVKGKCPKQTISVLSDEQVEEIHLASLEILEGTGMFVEAADALELLSGAGATVDGNRVKINPAKNSVKPSVFNASTARGPAVIPTHAINKFKPKSVNIH